MSESKLTKYQRFEVQRIHRRQLKNAPYNPREPLHPELAQRLRDNLSTVGLVEPLTWNKRTGYLVGGHQRLAALDVLTGHDNYELDVAVVELDDKTERQQNVFLNNPAVQGDWDMAALAELFKAPGFDVAGAGFSEIDVLDIFGEQVHAEIFGAPVEEPQNLFTPDASAPVEGNVVLILFGSRAEREQFMVSMGCDPDERYIDAGRVLAELGVADTNQPWAQAMAQQP